VISYENIADMVETDIWGRQSMVPSLKESVRRTSLSGEYMCITGGITPYYFKVLRHNRPRNKSSYMHWIQCRD
jgi:hypothetical protein